MLEADKGVVTEHISRKEFKYKSGDVQLGFTLRVDRSDELRSFKECLEKAILEVAEEITKLKN